MTFSVLWITMTIPAALIVAVGLAVRSKASAEDSANHWQQFLFISSASLLALAMIPPDYLQYFGAFLIPSLIGVFATFLLSLTDLSYWSSHRIKRTLLYVLGIGVLVVLLAIAYNPRAALLIALAFIVALIWKSWEWHNLWRLMVFLFLGLFVVELDLIPSVLSLNSPEFFQTIDGVAKIVLPTAGITMTARLIHSIFIGNRTMPGWSIALRLAFATLLIVIIAYQIIKAVPFDIISDGLTAVWIIEMASFAGVASAMLLAWSLEGNRRWVALGFTLIITLLLPLVTAIDFQPSPVVLTEQRAAQVNQAILRYHAQEGKYPDALVDLSPGYLWHIPEPIMFRSNNIWCYEGGKDYYRLGYLFHGGFGALVSVRIQGFAGTSPNPEWQCDRDLINLGLSLRRAEMQEYVGCVILPASNHARD